MRVAAIGAAMLAMAGAATAQTAATPAGRGQHWGGRTDGYWTGGLRAPGGYRAYRRPVPGYALPTYWLAPAFRIVDAASYGLTPPPAGYRWARYYDDAVLIDARGTVRDNVEGLDWDRHDLDIAPIPHVAAGTGNLAPLRRSEVADASGYAVARDADRLDDRRYGADYPPPPPGAHPAPRARYRVPADGPPPPYDAPPPGMPVVQRYPLPGGGFTTVTTTGYGYGYGPGGTTVTVETAPGVTTTTTTTEYVDRTVSYRRVPVRTVRYVKALRYTKTRGKLRPVKEK